MLHNEDIKQLLFEKADQYNRPAFIEDDPISIPHLFSKKEDIEIAALFSAIIAWGQRPVIIRNALQLMKWMDFEPYDFILNSNAADLKPFSQFKHRTFNGDDCIYFMRSLKALYQVHDGMESVFSDAWTRAEGNAAIAINEFRKVFLSFSPPGRTSKHIANPLSGSAAKRINMFLRWMVRSDDKGVDFGLWKNIPPSTLCCPLDVHTGNVSRGLGILQRNANDWRSVMELTSFLKTLEPEDPVRFDFALFGLGMYDGIK
jgi:uncharacterized protein (TIGR02757 family)